MSIDAMRQALAALEHEAHLGNDDAYRVERDVLRAAIEQAQEPVAWLTKELMADYLDMTAEAIENNGSEMLRNKAYWMRVKGDIVSIAAMKQALEFIDSVKVHPTQIATRDALHTALRAAIEQANEFNPDWDAMAVMVEEQQRMAKRIEELEAQAHHAASQAPMHYYRGDEQGNLTRSDIHVEQAPWVKTYAGGQPNYTTPEEPGVKLDASAPLVVQPHPAFKKWQGLTDDEIAEVRHLYDGTAGWTIERFARAIEAKLKEKNK